jgi:hypothetical protein
MRSNGSVGEGTSYFVDVLLIDEAAQIALANVLAVTQAA